MKKLLFFAVCTAGLALCSCGEKKDEVRDFATDFAEKVQANQIDSVLLLYPEAENIEAVALDFVPDSMEVVEDAEGVYTVNYGNGVKMKMKKNSDASMTVTETFGIASFPAEKMEFAKATGMYDATVNDVELANRMADTAFTEWLRDRFIKYRAKNLKVKGELRMIKEIQFMMDEGIIAADVENTTDKKIDGADYKVVFVYTSMGMGYAGTSKVDMPGKDIEPGQTVAFTTSYSGRSFPEKAYVDNTMDLDELFKKSYTPKSDDYSEYLKSKTSENKEDEK